MLELIDGDFNVDLLGDLDAALSFLEHCLVLGLLVEQVEQELINIVLLVLVLCKLFGELSRHCHLLTLQEALEKHLNREVDIVRANMVPQVDPRVGFAHSKHALNVSHGNLVPANRH